MCFLSVDLRLQMLMERSLLAIVSLMVFQIFQALYINCELGSGVIRKASFLSDSKYNEYKDIGILYSSVLNVSMPQWYTYKLWTVMRLCLFNNVSLNSKIHFFLLLTPHRTNTGKAWGCHLRIQEQTSKRCAHNLPSNE